MSVTVNMVDMLIWRKRSAYFFFYEESMQGNPISFTALDVIYFNVGVLSMFSCVANGVGFSLTKRLWLGRFFQRFGDFSFGFDASWNTNSCDTKARAASFRVVVRELFSTIQAFIIIFPRSSTIVFARKATLRAAIGYWFITVFACVHWAMVTRLIDYDEPEVFV